MRLVNRFNAVWIAFFGLSAAFAVLVSRYTVNILFSDQWDLEAFLVNDQNPIHQFLHIHGPHRQGLVFILWDWLQLIFGVDARIPAWLVLLFLILGTFLAIRVLRKQTQPLLGDVLIPIIFISPKLHETIFGTPNPSHGTFPLFLIFGITACFLIRNEVKQAIMLSILCFLLVFSGFGLVIIPIVFFYAVLFALKFLRRSRVVEKEAAGTLKSYLPVSLMTLTTLAAALFFLWDYQFSAAAGCFSGHLEPVRELIYSFNLLSSVIGFTQPGMVSTITGVVCFCTLAGIAAYNSVVIVRPGTDESQRKTASIILFTSAFTLLFALLTAYGRECLGISTAFESRYLPYVLPGYWAVYVTLKSSDQPYHLLTPNRKSLVALFVVCALTFEWRAYNEWTNRIWEWYGIKTAVNDCAQGDPTKILDCQNKLGVQVYPFPSELPRLVKEVYHVP